MYFDKVNSNEKNHDANEALIESEEKLKAVNELLKGLNESSMKKESEIENLNEIKYDLLKSNKDLLEFKTNRLNELTCKDCGHIAENDFGVAGHKKGCKSLKS